MAETRDDAEHGSQQETAELLEDIRIAEEQIARGEGMDHDQVAQRLRAMFRNRPSGPPT